MAIIRTNGCLGCHAISGEGASVGPAFDHIGSQAKAEEIRQKIVDPSSITAKGFEQFKGMMPATFGQQLTAAQLEAVVKFLASHK
jgi:cytochrome c551/c552